MVLRNKTPPDQRRKARALKYAAHGYRVVPVHAVQDGRCSCSKGMGCGRRAGKHPMTKHGVKDATTDRDRVTAWWTDSPNANIGIATGTESGILVLDIDPRNNGNKSLARLQKELGPLPDTVTAKTGGGGRHLIFKHPPFLVRKDTTGKMFGAGIDVLSDGCIMIAPPSIHASGNGYRWVKGKSYRDLEPAALPQAWQDRLRGGPAQAEATTAPAECNGDDLPAKTSDVITEGRRNNYLTSFAGTVQRSGASPEALAAAWPPRTSPSACPHSPRTRSRRLSRASQDIRPSRVVRAMRPNG